MSEYHHSQSVQASPDKVFSFVSDIKNLPKYLPTVRSATPQEGERIRIQGEVAGHRYDNDGFFKVDSQQRKMEWGSDGENNYQGWLEVQPDGEHSMVIVHLWFEPRAHQQEQFEQQTGDANRTIQRGLEDALMSIRNLIEERSGKVETQTAGKGGQRA
jgi:hypothetical protein